MTAIHHCIGGIRFRTDTDVRIDEFLHPRFAPFVRSPGPADCRIAVRHTGNGGSDDGPEDGPGYRVLRSADCTMRIDYSARSLEILLESEDPAKGDGHFRFGAFPYSVFLHGFDSLMLHAACVDFRGSGALLVAPDDGGKTTAAGLFPDGIVLADDMVLVRKSGDSFSAWGTPWTTFEPRDGSTSLRGLFFLEKSDRFGMEDITFPDAFSRLWSDHGFMGELMPGPHRESFFGLCCDLISSVPVRLLRFPRDRMDTGAVMSAMEKP